MWIDFIRYILKQETEDDFKKEQSPLPVSKINFWRQKLTVLNPILGQIKKKFWNFKISIEKQKSTYHDMLTPFQKVVEKAWKKGGQQFKYLKCLKDSFEYVPKFHMERKFLLF